jgi:hypothetical protein
MSRAEQLAARLTVERALLSIPEDPQSRHALVASWSASDLYIVVKFGGYGPRFLRLAAVLSRALGLAAARAALRSLLASWWTAGRRAAWLAALPARRLAPRPRSPRAALLARPILDRAPPALLLAERNRRGEGTSLSP